MKSSALLLLAAIAFSAPQWVVAKPKDKPAEVDYEAHLERLRAHYIGKQVTTVVDLPKTDGGYVYISDGRLDTIGLALAVQGSRVMGINSGGIGVLAGTHTVIGGVHLKPRYLLFYLGTNRGREWGKVFLGDEVEGDSVDGTGVAIVRGVAPGPNGIRSPWNADRLTESDLSIDNINASLAQVMDVRSLVPLDDLSAEHRGAVERGEVIVGMEKRSVILALGEPSERQTDASGDAVVEQWIYETTSLETIVVTITDGVVSGVRRF